MSRIVQGSYTTIPSLEYLVKTRRVLPIQSMIAGVVLRGDLSPTSGRGYGDRRSDVPAPVRVLSPPVLGHWT